MTDERASLERTIAQLTSSLQERRLGSSHWEGHLSSSALSTATAIVALKLVDRAGRLPDRSLVDPGIDWLIAHQNADGGWGDTTLSLSNLSTTALCWAALANDTGPGNGSRPPEAGRGGSHDGHDVAGTSGSGDTGESGSRRTRNQLTAIERAEAWLRAEVGELSANRLSAAIVRRYGRDRTFSVPILTTLALAGRLGPGGEPWRRIPQLPFELAACPHQWFHWMRLPVVSYALPALVALGQVRHHHAPTRNPLLRQIRTALGPRTLKVLRTSQPASGGYLEAIPLTSFVVMSLVAAGHHDDPVVEHAVRFLGESAREDGSWPIDTNLATWVTTLAVNALAAPGRLAVAERDAILDWLLRQQHREEHSFTHAAPGGWAWTNLSGGVPDADDTAGALMAMWSLGRERTDIRRSAEAGVRWLLGLQNRDGGIPTFCRGWGALPFDRSAADLTAHALEAWSAWHDAMPSELQRAVRDAGRRAVRYLAESQNPDGSWSPLWFGNQHTADGGNPTYGTARVLLSLSTALVRESFDSDHMRRRGVGWLVHVQNTDGGWGGGSGSPSSIEETGLALQACARGLAIDEQADILDAARRAVRWMIAATDEGRHTPAAPIGLYFARLWYFEELYPLVFGLAGLLETQSLSY